MNHSISEFEQVYVVIPAYNEEPRINKVIEELHWFGFYNLIIVDDCSTDKTYDVIPRKNGTVVLRHCVNLGPGASTMTGIEYALLKNAAYIATIDADHQHKPEDLVPLFRKMKTHPVDLMIGSRFLQKNKIPFSRLIYNFFGNIVSYFKTGILLSDSQSGLKIMSRKFAEQLYLDYNGFEFCIDIIKKAKLTDSPISELPIGVKYTKETLAKGQSFQNGVMMLFRMFNPFA